MQRLRAGTPATLEVTFYDGEDVADPGAVTVTVFRDDGSELIAETAAAGTGAAPRTLALTADDTALTDVLRAVWVSASHGTAETFHETIGGRYLTLAQIRGLRDLGDEQKFPTEALEEARTWWETLVEEHTSLSFVPKYARETLDGLSGSRKLLSWRQPRTIRSAIAGDGTTLDTSGWVLSTTGAVKADVSLANVAITYEHGHDQPDAEIVRASKIAIRSWLLENKAGSPSRELSIVSEAGTIRLAQPGAKYPTGIPTVDRVLNARTALLVA